MADNTEDTPISDIGVTPGMKKNIAIFNAIVTRLRKEKLALQKALAACEKSNNLQEQTLDTYRELKKLQDSSSFRLKEGRDTLQQKLCTMTSERDDLQRRLGLTPKEIAKAKVTATHTEPHAFVDFVRLLLTQPPFEYIARRGLSLYWPWYLLLGVTLGICILAL